MTRREKLDEIERMESAEISVICKKYKPLKDELKYQFKIEDIEAEGWEREDFYPALSGASYLTWFYINNKYPKKRIFIEFENEINKDNAIRRVVTGDWQNRILIDMDDLIDFQNKGK